MKDPTFLSLVEVLELHHESLARYGGQSGVRDLGLLESALAIPMASFGGQFLHSDVFEMAAAYAYHIAENQPFIDGNKRAALGSALGFLDTNDIELLEKNNEFYEAMILIGTRKMTKLQLADLFRQRVTHS